MEMVFNMHFFGLIHPICYFRVRNRQILVMFRKNQGSIGSFRSARLAGKMELRKAHFHYQHHIFFKMCLEISFSDAVADKCTRVGQNLNKKILKCNFIHEFSSDRQKHYGFPYTTMVCFTHRNTLIGSPRSSAATAKCRSLTYFDIG